LVEYSNTVFRLIGYLPEDFGLYPTLTVYENLDFAAGLYRITKDERKKIIRELLEFLDLWDRMVLTLEWQGLELIYAPLLFLTVHLV
jgi:ABC-type multidrug transport system ATPase subunit